MTSEPRPEGGQGGSLGTSRKRSGHRKPGTMCTGSKAEKGASETRTGADRKQQKMRTGDRRGKMLWIVLLPGMESIGGLSKRGR